MKNFIAIIPLLIVFSNLPANAAQGYRVYLATWDKVKVTGMLETITDSSISIQTPNGKRYTFTAIQTKHLKIWRRGLNLPAAMAGAVALTSVCLISAPKEDGLARIGAYIVGIPVGTLIGLFIGDQISTAVNERSIHINDFKQVRSVLAPSVP